MALEAANKNGTGNVSRQVELTAEDIIALTTKTFATLAAEKDLSPRNLTVTTCLTTYVNQLLEAEQKVWEKQPVLESTAVNYVRPHMLQILSQAEFEMEMFFADKFIEQPSLTAQDLEQFWYRDNYKALVAQELKGLSDLGLDSRFAAREKPIAFIGAGPLPLSAIDYVLQTGKRCVCFDIDAEATKRGRGMIERLGMADAVSFIEAPGGDVDYNDFGLVMVASLVQGKAEVLDRINETNPKAIVGVRSAEGLMSLLYEPVNIEKISAHGFTYQGTASATAETINSTCFFEAGGKIQTTLKEFSFRPINGPK